MLTDLNGPRNPNVKNYHFGKKFYFLMRLRHIHKDKIVIGYENLMIKIEIMKIFLSKNNNFMGVRKFCYGV